MFVRRAPYTLGTETRYDEGTSVDPWEGRYRDTDLSETRQTRDAVRPTTPIPVLPSTGRPEALPSRHGRTPTPHPSRPRVWCKNRSATGGGSCYSYGVTTRDLGVRESRTIKRRGSDLVVLNLSCPYRVTGPERPLERNGKRPFGGSTASEMDTHGVFCPLGGVGWWSEGKGGPPKVTDDPSLDDPGEVGGRRVVGEEGWGSPECRHGRGSRPRCFPLAPTTLEATVPLPLVSWV